MKTPFQPNILIVDDDQMKLKAIEEILSIMNLNIMKANSGNEAFRLLMKKDFALILLDVKMPGIDGYDIAELIRKRNRSQNTPIIFITSYSPDEINVKRGYSFGSVDYIFAPINPDILKAKVSVFVKMAQLNAQANAETLRTEKINNELNISNEKYRLLKNTNERLNFIFNAMPVVIFTLKPSKDFLVTFATQNTLEQLGYEADEFINEPSLWKERIHKDDAKLVFSGFSKLMEEDHYICEYRFKQKCGDFVWIQNVFKLIKENGQPIEIIGCLTDISERKLTEEHLIRKAAELERSNAELEHFAYAASHDLQEPLRTIGGYLQLIEKKNYFELFDESGKDYFTRVINGAKRMQGMINDLLEYSRVISNKERYSLCNCNEIYIEVINNLRAQINKTDAKITCDPLPTIEGNRGQLIRVFQNIISNGIKFHKENVPPELTIKANKEGNTWIFSFTDNGIGIKNKFQSELFEIFQRLNPRDKFPGNGIGLAMCKKVINNHGGEIWVESEFGKGSTFFFTIPDN